MLCAPQEEDILKQFPVFTSYSKGDFTGCVTFKHASQLSEEQKGHMWDIFESNMKDVYTQDNQKWSPKEKRREMFDVSSSSLPSPPPPTHTRNPTHLRPCLKA